MFKELEDNWALANRQKAWSFGEGKSEKEGTVQGGKVSQNGGLKGEQGLDKKGEGQGQTQRWECAGGVQTLDERMWGVL